MHCWFSKNVIAKFIKVKEIQNVIIRNVIIMLMLYTNNVVLFCKYFRIYTTTNEGIEMFYIHIKASVISFRTNTILEKSKNEEKPCLPYLQQSATWNNGKLQRP